jgi:hypothetical protein
LLNKDVHSDALHPVFGIVCLSRIPFLLIWLPAIIGIFYLKFVSLRLDGPFGMSFWALPVLGKLTVFRSDILICFLAIPLGLFLLVLVLPQWLRGTFVALFSIGWLVISYGNVQGISAIGRLYSFNLLSDSFHWARNDPRSIREYIKLSGVIRALTLMALSVGIAWWAGKQCSACLSQPSIRRKWFAATRAVALPLAAIIVIPWLTGFPSSSATQSVLLSSIRAFWGLEENEAQIDDFRKLSPTDLIAKYRELAHIEVSSKDPRYWSRAEDSDVIVFVFETSPAQILPIDGNLDDFPNLRMLRDRSFVAPKHYTTYPYTNRAIFSCFSGWYPSDFRRDFVQTFSDLEIPGLARKLSSHGYKTAFYTPFPWQVNYDISTSKALGFAQLSFAHPSTFQNSDYETQPWMAKRADDLDSLRTLESDVESWLTKDQRFLAVFAPQLSHSPWFDVTPDGRLKNLLERGRPLMALQDAYLGEILKLLAAHNRLEKTIIVVLGDHGLRTREEDPDLPIGMIDDISFHVPMLIYAPQVLNASVSIPWLTSHIDISPTLLDLVGLDRQRDLEQGSPVWDSAIQSRTTFLFARHYFAADGFYSNGQFVMWNQFMDKAFANNQLHFSVENALTPSSPEYRKATDSIQRMVSLQQRWVEVFGRGDAPMQVIAKSPH